MIILVSRSLEIEIFLIITDFSIEISSKSGFSNYSYWFNYMKKCIEAGDLNLISDEMEFLMMNLINFFGFDKKTMFELLIRYFKNADKDFYHTIIISYKNNYDMYIN